MNGISRAPLAAVIVMVLALIGTACAQTKSEAEAVPAPEFSLKDLQGNALSLASYKGKILILNFWATWCPPCRREIPDFIEAYKELKSKGLEILGVSVDELSAEALRDWTQKAGLNYPVALATAKVIADYQPGEFIPATIVIDRSGHIRYRQSSLMDKETLLRLFEEYSK